MSVFDWLRINNKCGFRLAFRFAQHEFLKLFITKDNKVRTDEFAAIPILLQSKSRFEHGFHHGFELGLDLDVVKLLNMAVIKHTLKVVLFLLDSLKLLYKLSCVSFIFQ